MDVDHVDSPASRGADEQRSRHEEEGRVLIQVASLPSLADLERNFDYPEAPRE